MRVESEVADRMIQKLFAKLDILAGMEVVDVGVKYQN